MRCTMVSMKISVIIPAFNVCDYLEQCVLSVLSQTHRDIEVILIDDGSKDSTPKVCDKLCEEFAQVVVFHKSNGGVSSARNVGILHATGDFIMFVDGDDWLEPTCLEEMLRLVNETNSEACSCNKYLKNNIPQIATSLCTGKALQAQQVVKKHLHYGFIASPCLTLWKRDCVKEVLFNEKIHTLEDWEYNFRCLTKIQTICILDGAYYHYRTVEGSASVSPLNSRKLTSLEISRYVDEYIESNHLDLAEEAKYVPVFLSYHMLVIYSTQGGDSTSVMKLRSFARNTLRKVMFNKQVDLKHKTYLLFASIHPALFKELFNIKNKKRI